MTRKHHHHHDGAADLPPAPADLAPDTAAALTPAEAPLAASPVDPVAAVPPELEPADVFGGARPAIDTAPFVDRSAPVVSSAPTPSYAAGMQPDVTRVATPGTAAAPDVAGMPSVSSYTSTTIEQGRLAAAGGRRVLVTRAPADEMEALERHPDPVVRARAVEAGVAIRAGAPNAGILARAARDMARMADGLR